MDRKDLKQQHLEDEEVEYKSFNRQKVYPKQIEHPDSFTKSDQNDINHLQDIIKRSKTSPLKTNLSLSKESLNESKSIKESLLHMKEHRSSI